MYNINYYLDFIILVLLFRFYYFIVRMSQVRVVVLCFSYYFHEPGCKDFNGFGDLVFYKIRIPNNIDNEYYWKSIVVPQIRKLKKFKNFKHLTFEGFLMKEWYLHYYEISSRGLPCCNGLCTTGDYLFCEEKNPKREDLDLSSYDEDNWIPLTISYQESLKRCSSDIDSEELNPYHR